MMNVLKSHWIAIAICLVYSLIATGTAIYFIKSASDNSKSSSLKMAEDLKTTQATLSQSDTEMESIKGVLDKERTINAELKKTITESNQELENLRKLAVTKKRDRSVADSGNCQGGESASLKNKLRNLQAELDRRGSELSERQKKLNSDMNALANEKRKLSQEKSNYSWP